MGTESGNGIYQWKMPDEGFHVNIQVRSLDDSFYTLLHCDRNSLIGQLLCIKRVVMQEYHSTIVPKGGNPTAQHLLR